MTAPAVLGPAAVRGLLPHRYPILLVDRVVALETGHRVVALKAVTCNEPWYAGVGGTGGALVDDDGLAYPFPLLVESWVQAAALLATVTRDADGPGDDGTGADGTGADAVLLLGALTAVVPGRHVLPGDVVEHHVDMQRSVGHSMVVTGHSVVGTERVLTVGSAVLAFRGREGARP